MDAMSEGIFWLLNNKLVVMVQVPAAACLASRTAVEILGWAVLVVKAGKGSKSGGDESIVEPA